LVNPYLEETNSTDFYKFLKNEHEILQITGSNKWKL